MPGVRLASAPEEFGRGRRGDALLLTEALAAGDISNAAKAAIYRRREAPSYLCAVCVVLSVTSWYPPSTIDVAETSVIFASRWRSGIVVTPQLHIVDFTL